MEIHGSDRVQGPKRVERKTVSAARSAAPQEGSAPADQVQISAKAQHLSSLTRVPDVRMERILQIREEISNGTYETPDKLEKAVERLLEDLG